MVTGAYSVWLQLRSADHHLEAAAASPHISTGGTTNGADAMKTGTYRSVTMLLTQGGIDAIYLPSDFING